jgi:hypothetical protein
MGETITKQEESKKINKNKIKPKAEASAKRSRTAKLHHRHDMTQAEEHWHLPWADSWRPLKIGPVP